MHLRDRPEIITGGGVWGEEVGVDDLKFCTCQM